MDVFRWFIWAFILLLAVLAVLIFTGKGDFLLFGRKKEAKEAYHVKRTRLVYGLATGLAAGMLACFALFIKQMHPVLRSWWTAVIALVSLAAGILGRTVCRK